MPRVEVVEFNGITFRRYPDAERRSDRVYFTPGGTARAAGVGRLHEEVWRVAHGPIPDGSHIHHADGDPLNNDLGNLRCITPAAHVREHWTPERAERNREHLARVGPRSAEWHRSPAGRAWHAEQASRILAERPARQLVCEQCGDAFESSAIAPARFCSNNCKAKWRRDSGADDVDRTCAICGATFRTNRYGKAKTCSRACGGVSQSRTKRGLRPDGR